mgnify:FL=1
MKIKRSKEKCQCRRAQHGCSIARLEIYKIRRSEIILFDITINSLGTIVYRCCFALIRLLTKIEAAIKAAPMIETCNKGHIKN